MMQENITATSSASVSAEIMQNITATASVTVSVALNEGKINNVSSRNKTMYFRKTKTMS